MKKLMIAIAAIALTMSLSNCSKDDDAAGKLSEIITGKNWKVTAMTVNPALFGVSDWYAAMEECEKDNFMTFYSDGTTITDEGATICDTGDPQQVTDHWTLSADEKTLTLISSEDTTAFTVKSFSASKISTTYSEAVDLGTGPITYTFNTTFEVK
jgi:hypothetical protein